VEGLKQVAANKENQAIGTSIAGGALIADGAVGLGKRGGLRNSIGTIVFAIVWIVFTSFLLSPITEGGKPAAGETTTQGQIFDLSKDREGYCGPLASFKAGDGQTYETRVSYRSKPCGKVLGETVTVIYNPADPTGSARVASPASELGIFGIFPWIGWGLLALGIFGLIKNISFIAAGIALLRKGLKDRKRLKSS
jgi:hypothetical protein